jgi:hypothetical protein
MLAPVVMFAPVVIDEWCLLCLFDFASAAKVEPTSPAIASAPINSLVFIMDRLLVAG